MYCQSKTAWNALATYFHSWHLPIAQSVRDEVLLILLTYKLQFAMHGRSDLLKLSTTHELISSDDAK